MPLSWATILGLSLLPEIDSFLPTHEGAFSAGLAPRMDITNWMELWTRRRTLAKCGPGRRESRDSVTDLPVLLTG
ncbi:MAG: hypothetical protein DMG78_26670 [Acidobacteria bacterium]|jgi:hypothetical protein|nr:MAG: hypothetical protein DMG78_26670 [Acidobacteriota bacterium]